MRHRFLYLIIVFTCWTHSLYSHDAIPASVLNRLNTYNVGWDTPSTTGSLECMPIGNGDITANVWAEKDGDLLFYIGKSDSWSEATRLLKIGRVRIHFTPNPLATYTRFQQILQLTDGSIQLSIRGQAGEQNIRMWVDANHPAIRIEIQSDKNIEISCTTELLRPQSFTLPQGDHPLSGSFRGIEESRQRPFESADHTKRLADRIVWFHRNESSFFPILMAHQQIGDLTSKFSDPYMNRTFGAGMSCKQMTPLNDSTLVSKHPGKEFQILICPITSQTFHIEEWQEQLEQLMQTQESSNIVRTYQAHRQWWHEFWNRSWIFLSGDEQAEKATRAWLLQRFMMACQSRGSYPVKFNGGTLTFDYQGMNADFRRWGPGYWHQNCRLYYWPLLASGDFDLMKPWFDMYMNMLPLQQEVTKRYYGHEGAFFPETFNFFGLFIQDDWGWDNAGKASQTRWIRYHYSGALEMLAMMQDYYDYTQEESFAYNYLLPFATQVIRFFDRHWPRIGHTLNFIPANSLEQFWDCLNPTDYIAGLNYTICKLLKLPQHLVDENLRSEWEKCAEALPPLPIKDGKILPAEEYGIGRNFENPELYTIFPFRIYGYGLPDYSIAVNTFRQRIFKNSNCWSQDAIQAALLGLAEEARSYIMQKVNALDASIRFPAFWKPGSDYTPDFDNGGVIANAIQYMLLQQTDGQVNLLPALPEGWDADFKLHLYGNKAIRVKSKEGKIILKSIFSVF